MSEPAALDDLTIPRRDTTTLRHVQRTHARVLVRDFATVPLRALGEGHRELHQKTVALVQDVLARDPRAVVRVLRHPTVQAVLGAARRQALPGGRHAEAEAHLLELDLLVLLELARKGERALTFEIPRQGRWPVLRSPAANLELAIAPEVSGLVFEPGRLTLRGPPADETISLDSAALHEGPLASARAPYHPIASGILFATTDNNPLANVQGHPERAGNKLDLGGHPVEEWLGTLREAFAIVDAHLPLVAEEMRQMLELVVPVGWHDERHFSCSFEEAVGAIYLTLHPSPMTMAEALIHEFQHNKLNAVFRFDPLLHDAHAAVHRSPVRPDLRPLHGVLMAVHAFQPVARLYENMSAAGHPLAKGRDWPRRFRDILRINREGARTVLQHGRPTPLGRSLLREMRELDDYFRHYELLQWPPAMVGSA